MSIAASAAAAVAAAAVVVVVQLGGIMMQNTGDYYQRAPRCCPGRNGGNTDSLRISSSVRGAELLCCCCSCSTSTSTNTPGLLASLGVCVLVLGYTLLGAFAFMALEGGLKSVRKQIKKYFDLRDKRTFQ